MNPKIPIKNKVIDKFIFFYINFLFPNVKNKSLRSFVMNLYISIQNSDYIYTYLFDTLYSFIKKRLI
jgi:hypothetical protein